MNENLHADPKIFVPKLQPKLLRRIAGAIGEYEQHLRQRVVTRMLRGVKIEDQHFGKNSITLGPGGLDLLRWNGSQAPLARGDIGMNLTNGSPAAFALQGNVAVGLLPGLQFLGQQVISSTPTPSAINFTVASSSDYAYFMLFNIVAGSGGSGQIEYQILENGIAATPTSNVIQRINQSGLQVTNNTSAIPLGGMDFTATNTLFGSFSSLWSPTGVSPQYWSNAYTNSYGSNPTSWIVAGTWNVAANITQLGVAPIGGSSQGLSLSTTITLYRYRTS